MIKSPALREGQVKKLQTAYIVCMLFAFSFLDMTPNTQAAGLPVKWERPVVIIEIRRPAGKPCPAAPPFASPAEESKAPEYCPIATAFVMRICALDLVISNRHVLSTPQPLFVRAKDKKGRIIHIKIAPTWKGHPINAIDIAASRMYLPSDLTAEDLDVVFFNEDKVRRENIADSFFLKFKDVRVGDEVLMVGYPSSIPGVQAILQSYDTPIFRGGIVSAKIPGRVRIEATELHDVLLIDMWSFPGNSGSPVFFKASTVNFVGDRDNINLERAYIIGVQGGNFPNVGLAVVYSADGIEETAAQFPEAKCIP